MNDKHTAEKAAGSEPMHRWIEPHGDLTACGVRWWNGTRGDNVPVTCPACITNRLAHCGAGFDHDWHWFREGLELPYADHPDYREEWRP